MNKFYKIYILQFLLVLVSCNSTKKNPEIQKFENLLGEQETIYLNEIISGLDSFLEIKYPDAEFKFESYLKDIVESETPFFWAIDSVNFVKYQNSKLFNKYETMYPDSVWHEEKSIIIRYPDGYQEQDLGTIEDSSLLFSEIELSKKQPSYKLVEESNFRASLEGLKSSDSLIVNYLEVSEFLQVISPNSLASGLLWDLNEKNEYFAKRILMLELYKK